MPKCGDNLVEEDKRDRQAIDNILFQTLRLRHTYGPEIWTQLMAVDRSATSIFDLNDVMAGQSMGYSRNVFLQTQDSH